MGAPGGASEVSAARMMMDGQSPSASRETRGGMESNETGASRQTMPMEGGDKPNYTIPESFSTISSVQNTFSEEKHIHFAVTSDQSTSGLMDDHQNKSLNLELREVGGNRSQEWDVEC